MLRRISLIAASAAMLAFSALPASAATMQSATAQAITTHKLSFPAVHGITAWGTYIKTSKFVRLSICAIDTARANFAVGAVGVGTNANNTRRGNLGAVSIGYHQKVCRSGLVRYTAHLYVYTFIANNKGRIVKRSAIRKIY